MYDLHHAAPEVNSTGFIRFEIQDNTAIQLDWSETFLLNGILQYYELIGTNEVGEDVSKSQGSTQSRTLFGEPRGISKSKKSQQENDALLSVCRIKICCKSSLHRRAD